MGVTGGFRGVFGGVMEVNYGGVLWGCYGCIRGVLGVY
jgi:hypothetical protein